jgi:hypothetical protein
MAVMALAGLLPFASPAVALWTLKHIDRREAEKAAKAAARSERTARKKTRVPGQAGGAKAGQRRNAEPTPAEPIAAEQTDALPSA